MTKSERAELDMLRKKERRTPEEDKQYRALLQKLFSEELYWGEPDA